MDTKPGRLDRSAVIRLATVLIIATAMFPIVGHSRATPTHATEDAWDALRAGGNVALIRHALAPGTGDPAGFVLEDCATQRTLSDEGRAQAMRIGEAFRANDVAVDQVLSSGWCRCLDTATLAFGAAEVWPPLHSFFSNASTEPTQTAETRARVAAWTGRGTLVMVTHQVNITALTGIFLGSGEVIVLDPAPDQLAGFVVVGRITVD